MRKERKKEKLLRFFILKYIYVFGCDIQSKGLSSKIA